MVVGGFCHGTRRCEHRSHHRSLNRSPKESLSTPGNCKSNRTLWFQSSLRSQSQQLLVPITACISQLKWSYFESPRSLSQMQVFDDASWGPRGALLMLWKTRTTISLPWLGALVTLLLLAFDPFTQRVVGVKTRDMELVNETSTISYAPSFKDERLSKDVVERLVDPHGKSFASEAIAFSV